MATWAGDRDNRARTNILLSHVRWAGAAISIVQGFVVLHGTARWAGLAIAGVITAYNVLPSLSARLGRRATIFAAASSLAGDFAVATAWTVITSGDAQSLTYTFFACVGIEAAFLFGRLGAAAAGWGYAVLLVALTTSGAAEFGGPLEPGLVYHAALVLLPTAFAAALAEHLAEENRRVRAAEEQTRTIVENSISAVITVENGRVTGWNRRAETMFGWAASDVIGMGLEGLLRPLDWPRGRPVQVTGIRRSGDEFPIDLAVSDAETPARARQQILFAQDASFRRRTESLQAARYGVTYSINQAYSLEDGVPAVLQAVCQAMEWPVGALWTLGDAGLRFDALWHADGVSGADLTEASRDVVLRPGEGLPGKAWASGAPMRVHRLEDAADGRERELLAEGLREGLAFPVRHGEDVLGVVEFYMHREQVVDDDTLVALADIGVQVGQWLDREGIRARLRAEEDARRAAEERARRALHHRAFHDLLTGLPNRHLFADRLGQALALARREQKRLAVLLLDVDRFKDVNDRFGHFAGDVVLEEVADRLRGALRDSDTAARIGGDEFAILPGGDIDEAAVEQIRDHVQAAFAGRPWLVEGEEVDLDVSIGVAFYPEDGDEAGALMEKADAAMYAAKRLAGAAAEPPA